MHRKPIMAKQNRYSPMFEFIYFVVVLTLLSIFFYRLFKAFMFSYAPQGESLKSLNRKKFLRNVEAKKRALMREAKVPMKSNYEPQSIVTSKFYLALAKHLRTELSDVMVSKLEGLIALYFALAECTSKKQFIAIMTLYAKSHSSKSLSKSILELSESLFAIEPQSSDSPDWLNLMTQSLTDWKLVINNPGFVKVSKIISMLVTLGVFESSEIKVGGLTVFAAAALKTQVTAVDLVDCVAETIVFFAEGAYKCFLDGSFRPLLFSSSAVIEVEKRYIDMLALWEYARNGNLKRFVGMDEAEFDAKLKQLVIDLEDMYKGSPAGAERKILADRWREMSKILTEFESSRVRGGLRKSPFCFKVFGESAVGKSTFTDVVLYSLLKANGYPAGDDYVITLNPDDKHMSNMRSYVTAIKIDDYGNTKLDYVDLAPSDWLVQICNNIKRYAVMADLANKGKVSIEPAVCAITTNVEDLLAHSVSNEPVSIGRRAHVHVDLKVRPEFCKLDDEGKRTHMLDPRKVFEKYGDSDEIQDIWMVTVRMLKILPNDTGGKRIAPSFRFEDMPGMTKVSIFKFLEYAISESRSHFSVQDVLVKQCTNLADRLPWCSDCSMPSQVCTCKVEPQFGARLAAKLQGYSARVGDSINRTGLEISTRVEDIAVEKLISSVQWFESSPYSRWTNYVPDSLIDNEYVRSLIYFTGADIIEARVRTLVSRWIFFTSVICYFLLNISFSAALFFAIMSFLLFMAVYASLVEHVKYAYYERLKRERNVMPALFKSIREKHMHYVCGAIAGFGLIWAVVKTVKALRSMMTVQGTLEPKNSSEVEYRAGIYNPWTSDTEEATNPGTEKRVGRNCDFTNRVAKNMWIFSYEVGDNDKWCQSLNIRTGYFLIPKHILPDKPVKVTLNRGKTRVDCILDPTRIYNFDNGDLCLFYVANAPDAKDLIPYFANDYERRMIPATCVFTNDAGDVRTDRALWKFETGITNGFTHFNGSHYTLWGTKTFGGLCMATFFSESVHKCILGVHLGGITGTYKGVGMAITRPELSVACDTLLSTTYCALDSPQSVDIEDFRFGRKIAISPDLHVKSPVKFMDDPRIVVYGTVSGRSIAKSKVTPTVISDAVADVTGTENVWGKPKMVGNVTFDEQGQKHIESWKPWYESLLYSSHPSIGFAASKVDRAVDDYLVDMKEVFDSQRSTWTEKMKPLDEVTAVSGIDGWRFIDSMATKTSMGYPITGPKKPYLVKLDPEDYPGISEPKIFTSAIMTEYRSMLDEWAKGNNTNNIFGSSLKDEPTKVTKDKVRVFQAAPVCLQLAIRTYFLPIASFLSLNPLKAECAVGINSSGPEWGELADHMRHFGSDRIIAGDYSKYDLRMPAQLTVAAFRAMIEIAKWSGNYTARDIKIMHSLIYEVTCPLVNFNGDLIRLLGTNPSGQNMTVYVNSIANSILHRMGFYDAYPDEASFGPVGRALVRELGRNIRFRDIVKLCTYGDDAKGSVKEGFDKFTHITFANFLKANDMVFTMPDKESAPVHFMTDEQADFLKRKNRYSEELDTTVAMLDESSIFKSLHSILEPKDVTPEEVAAQNIDGALREWFFYGREHFEMRRAQMKEVARRTGMLCMTLDEDFDYRVDAWKDKYS